MPSTKTKKAAPKKSSGGAKKSAPKKTASGQTGGQMDKFFIDCLKDIYWAEKHLLKALPKLQKAASSEELQQALEDHTAQTEEQISRLDQVFEQLGQKAQGKKCDGMEGLGAEAESVIEETEDGSATRDAGIIVSAQKVEHYEIAAYGSLVALANTMGQEEVADLLNQTLEEEKETDQLLTQIAENNVNWEAGQESEEGEGEEGEEQETEEGE